MGGRAERCSIAVFEGEGEVKGRGWDLQRGQKKKHRADCQDCPPALPPHTPFAQLSDSLELPKMVVISTASH